MISYEMFNKFLKMYSNGEFPNQRIGQAFLNHFGDTIVDSDPELFYESNRKIAFNLIHKNYVGEK